MKPTIIVTGASGQVGNELKQQINKLNQFEFIFTDVKEMDITDETMVDEVFEKYKPAYCLNCAAYTAVDNAESNEIFASKINTGGAVNLASACMKHEAHLIHLSTDYVYHNEVNRPLIETDSTQPRGVYAKTKLSGDFAVLKMNPEFTVIRTSWVYSSFGHNFVKTMIRLGQEKEQLNIVFDQVGTPTYAKDLASAMLHIINQLETKAVKKEEAGGIFHFSNEGVTGWYDFALAIFDLEGIDCNVSPIESKAYPTPAARPHYSLLNKEKIKTTFDLSIPHWRTSLKSCLTALKKEA